MDKCLVDALWSPDTVKKHGRSAAASQSEGCETTVEAAQPESRRAKTIHTSIKSRAPPKYPNVDHFANLFVLVCGAAPPSHLSRPVPAHPARRISNRWLLVRH